MLLLLLWHSVNVASAVQVAFELSAAEQSEASTSSFLPFPLTAPELQTEARNKLMTNELGRSRVTELGLLLSYAHWLK